MSDQTTTIFSTRIDIDLAERQPLIDLLNQQLVDTFDMVSLIKQAHWNVKGPQFIALHQLFDDLAAGLTGYVDILAERITALGGWALGTVRMAAKASRLDAYPPGLVADMETVSYLSDQMARLAASTRAAAERAESLRDMGTNDLFIEVVRDLDKWLWFLEAHIQTQ